MEFYDIISNIVMCVAYILAVCFINKVEFKDNKKDILIMFFIFLIVNTFLYVIDFGMWQSIIKLLLYVLTTLYLTHNKKIKSIISTIYIFCFTIIYELLFLIFMFSLAELTNLIVFEDLVNLISTNTFYSMIYSLIYSGFLILIFKHNKVIELYNKISSLKSLEKLFNMVLMLVIPFSIVLITFIYLWHGQSKITLIVLFSLLIILISYVTIKNIKITNISNETKEKYTNTLKSLTEYEDMIDKYRVSNHENKNQLQMIRTMIHQKDKTVEKYIDNLLDNVYMVNEKLMMDVSMLPSGIKATVYTKMVLMENKRIKYKLNVDRKLRMVDYFDNESSTEIGLKICNILSVFLDNAIEEVENKKDPEIYIEVFYDENDNELTFEISNEIYTKDVDTSKIFEKGYTTKSNGHGYGLALVKEIIDANNNLKNETIIKNNIFTQRLTLILK